MLLCLCPCQSHACMLGFAYSHAFMFISKCLDVYPHAYMRISMLICVDRYVYMLRSMFSTCFLPSSMCLHASRHVYVLRDRPCLSWHVLLWPICSFYHIFLCFALMVRTPSRPYGLCHRPYTKAHIKEFGSSYLHVYACLLLCFMLVLASLVLGFAMLDALHGLDLVWLHSMSMRPCLDVTILEVSLDARLLYIYPSLTAPCDAVLTMFVCATRWLSMHLCMLVHMSMHESCLLVCRPCFNTMKLWTFDPNLHLSLVDTTFCLLSCLFAFSLV